jgi:hypothetical protein
VAHQRLTSSIQRFNPLFVPQLLPPMVFLLSMRSEQFPFVVRHMHHVKISCQYSRDKSMMFCERCDHGLQLSSHKC